MQLNQVVGTPEHYPQQSLIQITKFYHECNYCLGFNDFLDIAVNILF